MLEVLAGYISAYYIEGDLYSCYNSLNQCPLYGYFRHPRHLTGRIYDCLVIANIIEDLGEVDFLMKIASALSARHLTRDGYYTAAFFLCVIESINKVEGAGAGRPRAGSEPAG
jgi:hypothetical protein